MLCYFCTLTPTSCLMMLKELVSCECSLSPMLSNLLQSLLLILLELMLQMGLQFWYIIERFIAFEACQCRAQQPLRRVQCLSSAYSGEWTHLDSFSDIILILLDPSLNFHEGYEKPQIRSKGIIMFLRFQSWCCPILRNYMEMKMPAISRSCLRELTSWMGLRENQYQYPIRILPS